ncbi:substrate-binding domain-containing protein [Muriicola soli]|uniref:ABC transporter substrate-binding protein n=1 Tax=Muriicola soli TaxID=2507538 RepID=A0A411E8T1_9FLAO|nr:substrate-binding domain-containing protein [Muriicola soli]QBA64121.1 ABC transporter substrate-binding protein [Muriicola soli]
MKKIKIAGVPEHFNLPWLMAIEEGAFASRGIDVEWIDVPEGSGKMCKMMQTKEVDLAIVLTDGLVKSISDGNPLKIIQAYVDSPLQWGIHVAANSEFEKLTDLEHATAAISRFGSGSHLMAFVLAEKQGWDVNKLSFEVVNTLDGAIDALKNKKADYFMWEHFTTKPLVTQGIFRRLGDCPTPWPCFVITAHEQMIAENGRMIRHILEVINTYTVDFKRIPSIDRTLANRYQLELEDIQKWLGMTRWSQSQIESQVIDNVINTLFNLNLVSNKIDPRLFLTNL